MAGLDSQSGSLVSGLKWRWDTDHNISQVLDNHALPLLAMVRQPDPDIPLQQGDVLLLHSSYSSHKVLAQCMDRQGGRLVGPMFNIGYSYPGTFEVMYGEGRIFDSVQEILKAVEEDPSRVFKVLVEEDVILNDKERVPKSVAHNLGMYSDRKHACRKGDILLPEGKAVRLAGHKGMGRFSSVKEWKRTLTRKKERSKIDEKEEVYEYLVCSNQSGEVLYLPAKHRSTFTSIRPTSSEHSQLQVKDILHKMKLPVDVKLLRGEIPKGDFRSTPFFRLLDAYKESVVLTSLVRGDKVKAAMELSTSALLQLCLADTSSREYAELLIRLHTQSNVLPRNADADKAVSVAASTTPTGKSAPMEEIVDIEENASPAAYSSFKPDIYSSGQPVSPSSEDALREHQSSQPTGYSNSRKASIYQKLKLPSLIKKKSRAKADVHSAAAGDAVNVYKEAMEAIDSLQTVTGQETANKEAQDERGVEEVSLSFVEEKSNMTKKTGLLTSNATWEKFGEDFECRTPASSDATDVTVIPSPLPQTVTKPRRPAPPVPAATTEGLQNLYLKKNTASTNPGVRIQDDTGWVSLRTSSGGQRNIVKTMTPRPTGPPPPIPNRRNSP
ncbi:GAREM1 [Branchiostoma lanceolatum]|uniref:GAREM1 protein n=1 Tax=Branchiostoma lanceolatum TaxID=7740 RepID=A0A8J9ZG11_BRALA|nr:GAREM1 [Branchiostoma lanceolatum]